MAKRQRKALSAEVMLAANTVGLAGQAHLQSRGFDRRLAVALLRIHMLLLDLAKVTARKGGR